MYTNKKLLILALIATVLFAACSHKRSESDAARKAPKEIPDTTIYAKLVAVDGDSIGITMLNHDKSFRLNIADSKFKGSIKGDLNVGDTLAVMANTGTKTLKSAVNLSMIPGLWLIKDGKGDALRLASDGGASWVGARTETLRSWFITNGMFVMTYILADGSDYNERRDTAEIQKLSRDSLTVMFKDKAVVLTRSNGLITIDDLKK